MKNDRYILGEIMSGHIQVNAKTGNAYSIMSNTPKKPLGAKTKKGYLRTSFNNRGSKIYAFIHRIIWISTHGIPPKGMYINHINGIKSDNRISNLELLSNSDNMKHAASLKLTKGGWKNAPRNKKGQFLGKKKAGRLLDGEEYNEYPILSKES